MAIVAADITFRYSGGAANTAPGSSLGGIRSTAAGGTIDDAVKNDLWDDVSSAEALAGDTEYRAFYVTNTHATLALQTARIYISSLTVSTDDEFDVALASEDVNVAIVETVANENTAPVGPTFSRPTTYAGGLNLNTGAPATGLTATSWRGVWIRRTVGASAVSYTNDTGTIKVEGDTS